MPRSTPGFEHEIQADVSGRICSKNKYILIGIQNWNYKRVSYIYNLKSSKAPEIINVNSKYYIAEISEIEKRNRPFSDPEVQESLNTQLNFIKKIENNTSILKDISMGALDKEKFKKFASENNLEITEYKINNLKQNEIFSQGIIKRIFLK